MVKNLVLGMLVLGAASSVNAADLTSKMGIGVKGGYSIPVFGNSFNDVADADIGYGGHISYNFSEYNRLEIGYFKSTFDNVDMDFDTYSLMHVVRLSGSSAFAPIFGYGAGLTKIHNYEPKNLKLALLGRLGFEQQLGSNFSLAIYADYQWTSKILGDIPGTKGLHTVTPTLALNWYIGGNSGSSVAYTDYVREDEVTSYASTTVKPADMDNDGVADADDKCPNSAAGIKVNSYGCAVEEKAQMKVNVEFATGKATLAKTYQEDIKELAEFMKEHQDTKVSVRGYTDNTGNWTFNEKLSQKRAQSVVDALAKQGIERSRLSAVGMGPRDPIADNATAEGRKENRRVVAEIIDTSSSKY